LLFELLHAKGSTRDKLEFLKQKFRNNGLGNEGIEDLEQVFHLLKGLGSGEGHVEFDIPLARGLSYYTGCIFEVKINGVSIGSVSGGGRYDNLTQAFGDKENLSGVGISFGVDRIFDAMEELKLFPKKAQISSKALVCHLDQSTFVFGLGVLTTLRAAGVASEIYPDLTKIKKQLDYANRKQIPYVLVIGSEEVSSGLIAFKNLETGQQEKLYLEQIIQQLKK
jgi:histidyl-tRNA synthetase